ncbi:alpha/beta hydrolase [Streptomyces sp. CBMA156]|uniref:alpha/beta hydrolase n=1 Tax=Streptomyces sp. CBMA156 TaxID=1930280 RepID=UPI0016620223|nr:alpha/beta hydrolase [Streptomyces sp. CBMA156]MBD0672639.1 alpha/beta hydrolase [Streptomyces sp. CBMA156]
MTDPQHSRTAPAARRPRILRRTAAAGLALVAGLAVTAAATLPAQAAEATEAGARGLDRYYGQHLDWHSCVLGPDDQDGAALEQAGARCTEITVPLDYGNPGGRTVTLAASRIKATDTRHRIGVLLLNDGGPGSPTIGAPPRVHAALKETAGRFDIVGLDPRFVGRSAQIDCGWPVGLSILSSGIGRAGFERQVTLQRDLAAKCRSAAGDLLPYASTRDMARDLDLLRGALGERKVSYLGLSYGTYLGTVYSQMFPGRLDRMVLDSALDPRHAGPELIPHQLPVLDHAFTDWADWAAARHGTYGLGRTRAEVTAGVLHTEEAAANRPLVLGSGADAFELDDSRVPMVLFAGLQGDSEAERAALAGQMVMLAEAAAGKPVTPTADTIAMLQALFGPQGSPGGSAVQAVLCADGPASHDPEHYWREIERSRAESPLFGPLLDNISPCAFWDAPREAPTQVRRDARALILSATGDPRTPYSGGVALHEMLPSSRLLTLQGANQHQLYGIYGNACVDDTVNAYLASGRLPDTDPTCTRQ